MTRSILAFVSIFCLLSTVLLTSNIAEIRQGEAAGDSIFIMPDGSIQGTTNIHTDDKITYVFTANISGASIIVERDNIIIDGKGYILQGEGNGTGIDLSERTNVTVKNAQIKNFNDGVTLSYSSWNMISWNNLTGNHHNGILLGHSSSNIISGNNVENNTNGIWVIVSSDNIISGNNVTANNGEGIALYYSSSGNTISGNKVTTSGRAMFISLSSNNTLVGNTLSNFRVDGQSISDFLNDVTVSNTVNGKPIYYWINGQDMTVPTDAGCVVLVNCERITVQNLLNLSDDRQGILLVNTTYSTITKNSVSNTKENPVIYLSFASSSNNISDNVLTNNDWGILLDSSSNNTVSGNNITNSSSGISFSCSVSFSLNNTVSGNILMNNGDGIVLSGSSNNRLANNTMIGNSASAITLIYSSSNAVFGNSVTNNSEGIWIGSSSNNSIIGNYVENNSYGIALWSSSSNMICHNNFVDNNHQILVVEGSSTNAWDDGYPSGGNYWSNYNGSDLMKGPFQNQTGSDGIGDTPYVTDLNNTDRYPLMAPLNPANETGLFASFHFLSGSCFGAVDVRTSYSILQGDFSYPLICVPGNRSIDLACDGWLSDYWNQPLNQKEVILLIDGEPVASHFATDQPHNLNWTFTLNLDPGIHAGELRFDGDEQYEASSFRFTILAYEGSQFNITRDAFHFSNYPFSFEEFKELVARLLEDNLVDKALEIPILSTYPFVSVFGHCFGMAASSSVYYLSPALKPEQSNDTYALSTSEALWDIDWYQYCMLMYLFNETTVSSSMNYVKSLLNSGTPVILKMHYPVNHVIAIVGYLDVADETSLVAYDSNQPNCTALYSVKDGSLLYDISTNVTSAVFVNPCTLPLPYQSTLDLIKDFFKEYFGLQIHSPVNVNITSTGGKQLLIENNSVVQNDFEDSYVYLAETKIILLPSTENCTIEVTGTGDGQVSLDCVFTSGDQVIVNQSQNITISNGSKLYLSSLLSDNLYVDSNGDGTIDQTITIPELPSLAVLLVFMIPTLLFVVTYRKKRFSSILCCWQSVSAAPHRTLSNPPSSKPDSE